MTFNATADQVVCFNCHKTPDEILEYSPEMTGEDLSATEYVMRNEGTYNPANGHFCCTECYIRIGQPSSPQGWVAP